MKRILTVLLVLLASLSVPASASAYDWVSVADTRAALKGNLGSDNDVSYARNYYNLGPFEQFIHYNRWSDNTVANVAAFWSGRGDGKQIAVCFRSRKQSWFIDDWTITGSNCTW
jgi:hypothetical protein